MRIVQTKSPAVRPGFTLVEIVTVIAIIAVLMALLLGATMRVLSQGADAQTKDEIAQFDAAINKFYQHFNRHYPPSRILLSNDPAAYKGGHPLGPSSWKYLTQIWPNLNINKSYDWSYGRISGKYYAVLEGDQCLVFFLGGMQVESPGLGCIGFADNDHDPTAVNDKRKRLKPFYPFQGDRLIKRSSQHPFFSYKDINDGNQPFVYFRSTGGKLGSYSATDCQSLGIQPYYWPGGTFRKYLNPQTFQIISAGRNGVFGPGGQYNPDMPNVPVQGKDDLSNFHPGLLGAPRS